MTKKHIIFQKKTFADTPTQVFITLKDNVHRNVITRDMDKLEPNDYAPNFRIVCFNFR